jgi:general secretion pathway protein N
MRALTLAAVGVVAYAAFLVATLPASVVAARIATETGGRVRLEEARGSAWDGAARATLSLAGQAVAIDALTWSWRPAALAAGRFAFDVEATRPQLHLRGEVGRSLSAWEAHGLVLEGNAAALAALVPLLAPWRPEGSVSGQAAALAWTPSSLSGEARLEWRNAALALSEVRPLGAYRAELRGEGSQARLALTTTDGPLRLSGQGTLSADGRLDFRGEARAEGPQAASLQPLLDLFGPRRPDGSRAWTLGAGSGAR